MIYNYQKQQILNYNKKINNLKIKFKHFYKTTKIQHPNSLISIKPTYNLQTTTKILKYKIPCSNNKLIIFNSK